MGYISRNIRSDTINEALLTRSTFGNVMFGDTTGTATTIYKKTFDLTNVDTLNIAAYAYCLDVNSTLKLYFDTTLKETITLLQGQTRVYHAIEDVSAVTGDQIIKLIAEGNAGKTLNIFQAMVWCQES